MVLFWIGILVGVVFAWFFAKRGFYDGWVMLFNIVVSIYLGIFLRPVIVSTIPSAGRGPYNNALTVLVTAGAAFLVLHGVAHIFFTSQFRVSVAKTFDKIGGGFLGFLAGLMIFNFAVLLISITPVSQNALAKEIDSANTLEQCKVSYLCWWCNLVNVVASRSDNKISCEQAIEHLLKDSQQNRRKNFYMDEPNEPTEWAEPNSLQTSPGPQ